MKLTLNNKKAYILSLLFLCAFHLFAQKNEIDVNNLANYNHAIKLFNNKAYTTSQQILQKASNKTSNNGNLKADIAYYEAMCAIKLNQTDADKKVLNFVENYPNSNKKQLAYLNVGNYYFENRNPANALKWYTKVDENALTIENKNELNFKMGYALLESNHLEEAKAKFKTLLSNPKYGNDSRYYYGYISYKQEDYKAAETTLTEIANSETYKTKANYYLLDISFKAGNFEKCITIGKELLPNADKKEQSDIAKIIGESYFNLQKYAEAIPYLTKYKGKNGKWNNTDYYQLGYAYFKQNDFENATSYFNKIIDEKNGVSQNAYYNLGECYLKLNKKPAALNAFKSASEMDFNSKIKEDAALNYAKLSYEEGNPYKSVPEVLQEYLNAYPNSKHYSKISELLITSYLHQQDYKGALTYLQKQKKSENNNQLIYEVSLYRAIQLFNEEKAQEAYSLFETATNSFDKTIKNKAVFWKAETDYLLGNYQKAVNGFTTIKNSEIEEHKTISYNLGYAYFKLKEYEKASTAFQEFLIQKNEDETLNDDASIRIADCFYASKKYKDAIHYYDKIISKNGLGADYAQYQKAMSNGFMGNSEAKINNLLAVVNNYKTSNLQDDALFQLATTYTTLKNENKAHEVYDEMQKNHSKSSYIPSVLLRQGLLFYNSNKSDKALLKFKEVVANHPNSPEAKQAVTNAKNVYIDAGKVNEYAKWVKGIDFVNVSNAELDNATYQSAENKLLENNTEKAIEGFQEYLGNFSNGIHALNAHFYLAQLFEKTNEAKKSIPHYSYVITQPKSEFTEEALNKLSQIYLQNQNWNKAIPLLEQLEKNANLPQNITYAQSNLMKGFYNNNQYTKAVEYAKKIVSTNKLEKQIKDDALLIIARSAFKTNDFATAKEYYTEVGKNSTGEVKAETLYYEAFFKHESKEFESSNAIIQKLIADYSTYKYWGVKSYIIMAKNYYALNDVYQATYILENIISNFTQFNDLIEEAKNELHTIKNNEAKTNESVNQKQ